MALNKNDRAFIDSVADSLRLRFEDLARFPHVEREDSEAGSFVTSSDDASTPVAITKKNLRDVSKRRVARDSYLQEVTAALNKKNGVAADVDLDKGIVYARGVPEAHAITKPLSLSQLKSDALRSAENLRRLHGEDQE